MPSQLGGAQTISQLSFRLDNVFGSCVAFDDEDYFDVRIYMRHTSVNNYASDPGYPGTAGFTQVWNGTMAFPSSGVYTYTLSTSFVYNGTQNLELLIENRGGRYCSGEPEFDRINDAGPDNFPGKVGYGSSWLDATSISSNRRFNLQINGVGCGGFPLPVTLTNAYAECTSNETIIHWTTASEQDNDYFTIERSQDGSTWREIAKVDGSGTKTSESLYSYSDYSCEGLTYYRLSQTDFNGDSEMLRILAVDCNADNKLAVYPNPFDNELIVNTSDDAHVTVVNAMGQTLNLTVRYSGNTLVFDTNELPKGVYFVQVDRNGEVETIKVFK
jgi:hypothetical protein